MDPGQERGSKFGCLSFRCSEMVRCSSALDCERGEEEERRVEKERSSGQRTFHKEDKALLSKKTGNGYV